MNYDSSQVGVPYIRVSNITIQYPTSGITRVTLEQETAVKLADNSIAVLNPIQSLSFTLDMEKDSQLDIPLIDPESGKELGSSTNLQQVMLGILAVIRPRQDK